VALKPSCGSLKNRQYNPCRLFVQSSRILTRNDLTHRRTGRYEPKGTPYPNLIAKVPNFRHQADFVGPRYLRGKAGSLRFYSMNIVDLSTGRCGTQPLFNRDGTTVYGAFWEIWGRLGMPRHLQVDNEMVFCGSPTHPRGMGPLIRLCLHYEIELWFIPQSEPWRNGVVEQFNNHYQQKFLDRVPIQTGSTALGSAALGSGLVSCNFETRLIKSLHGKTVKNRI